MLFTQKSISSWGWGGGRKQFQNWCLCYFVQSCNTAVYFPDPEGKREESCFLLFCIDPYCGKDGEFIIKGKSVSCNFIPCIFRKFNWVVFIPPPPPKYYPPNATTSNLVRNKLILPRLLFIYDDGGYNGKEPFLLYLVVKQTKLLHFCSFGWQICSVSV